MNAPLDGHGPAVLHLTSHAEPGGALLELAGDLDMATADELALACRSVALPPGGLLRLDLARLEFLDAAGLRALLAAHAAVAQRGSRMLLCGLRPLARQLVTITGLDAVLDLAPEPDRRAAV